MSVLNYAILTRLVPKTLTPFIEKIIDECASNEVLFFSWMVFQGIIKLKSGNKISIRPPSPLLGGLLLITLCHLG